MAAVEIVADETVATAALLIAEGAAAAEINAPLPTADADAATPLAAATAPLIPPEGIGVTGDATAPTKDAAGLMTDAETPATTLPMTEDGTGAREETKATGGLITEDGAASTPENAAEAADAAPETTTGIATIAEDTTGTAEDTVPGTILTAEFAGALTAAAAADRIELIPIPPDEGLAMDGGVMVTVTVAPAPIPPPIRIGEATTERRRGRVATTARGM
jgi:hypothetical protein